MRVRTPSAPPATWPGPLRGGPGRMARWSMGMTGDPQSPKPGSSPGRATRTTWVSGKPAVCKTAHPGSNPGVVSIDPFPAGVAQWNRAPVFEAGRRRFESSHPYERFCTKPPTPSWIGSRSSKPGLRVRILPVVPVLLAPDETGTGLLSRTEWVQVLPGVPTRSRHWDVSQAVNLVPRGW